MASHEALLAMLEEQNALVLKEKSKFEKLIAEEAKAKEEALKEKSQSETLVAEETITAKEEDAVSVPEQEEVEDEWTQWSDVVANCTNTTFLFPVDSLFIKGICITRRRQKCWSRCCTMASQCKGTILTIKPTNFAGSCEELCGSAWFRAKPIPPRRLSSCFLPPTFPM